MEPDWELILLCREAHDVARRIAPTIIPELERISKQGKIYTFKHRFKPPADILSKVGRKRKEGNKLRSLHGSSAEHRSEIERLENYNPNHVTDALGCRFVLLFQDHIPEMCKLIFSNLTNFNKQQPKPFLLKELIVYTNRRADDPVSIAGAIMSVYQDAVKAGLQCAVPITVKGDESRKNAYTSVHLTLETKLIVEHLGRTRRTDEASVEIQLRDIFEEGWGEIDHFVRYSEKDHLEESESGEMTELERALLSLKGNVSASGPLTQHVYSSHRKMEPKGSPSLEHQSATFRDQDRDALLEAIRGKIAADVVHEISSAYESLQKSEQSPDREEAYRGYQVAASTLEKCIAACTNQLHVTLPRRDNRTVGYFLRMELGNALLFGGKIDDAKKSRDMFAQIRAEWPKDSVVRLREARAIMGIDHSAAGFASAEALLRQAFELSKHDALINEQHWIRIALYVQISFVLWAQFQLKDADHQAEAANKFLVEAAECGLAGYLVWAALATGDGRQTLALQSGHKALSNLLYYTARIIRRQVSSDKFTKTALQTWIQNLHDMKVEKYRDYFKTEDNLMHAYLALGDVEEAKQYANAVFSTLKTSAETQAGKELGLGEISANLHPEERGCFRSAVETITT